MVEPSRATAPAPSPPCSVLAFRLERALLALPVECVLQIIPMVTLHPVPQLAGVIAGVINVHGDTVPVVDLRRHLGLPAAPLKRYTPIVLARVGGRTAGLIVDEVIDVVGVPGGGAACLAELLPPDLAEAPVVRGIARTPDGLLILLDPEHLFAPDQAEALARAAELLPLTPVACVAERPL